ncbi:hypothetical protein MLD38_024511 [Melastoma candidum]|uniref:Uncharacterized protein n=1 Tax=Melastoma candidum TaxID=119954 RepID=A0ACB9NV77_9MYRT|nr:hypothetical protein MLD38_024511 [Melastoma candidum]
MSTSGQPQFRYTQTPSKVVHLRNLPWECSEEELVEHCKPFGQVVNTKCGVGANKNQAFVEFAELSQAISMVSYYASSSEPAQIRGKTVYVQYSNRHEIVHSKIPGDVPGNVLLVSLEGVEPGDVSIDVIHLVFSAFGFVHKIATFEKAAGFQALIQFSDVETASQARNQLDGRSIPRYLLPAHVNTCNLRITYSAHTDLNIKFQSHRSRDYTNPYLPVNPTAIEGAMQSAIGKSEPESNVLLASIENMQYAVTLDALHMVFSAFGPVQKIAIFEKNGGTQALIQYPDIATATVAKEALEGHCIYDGGYCKLHLSYSRHTDLNIKAYSDRSRDYTIPDPSMLAVPHVPGVPTASGSVWQNPSAAPTGPVQPPVPGGQAPSWDPTMTARPSYPPASGAFPGQGYPQSMYPMYSPASMPMGPSPVSPANHVIPGSAQPGVPPNQVPGGSLQNAQPSYYSR